MVGFPNQYTSTVEQGDRVTLVYNSGTREVETRESVVILVYTSSLKPISPTYDPTSKIIDTDMDADVH